MENPQALDGGGPPSMGAADVWAGPWEQEAMASEFNIHAANANTAAYHAEVAAKHAASLAQWVQYLSGTLNHLQGKVTELEDWKRKALEETRKLREEHKALRRMVLQEEAAASPQSQQGSVHDEVSPSSPGLSLGSARAASDDGEVTTPGSQGDVAPRMFQSMSTNSLLPSTTASSQDLEAAIREEGVQVSEGLVDGAACQRAVWHIGHLSAKLRGCMGRALVSPPFSAGTGLDDVRLMISPDGRQPVQGKARKQKELFSKRITEGPLDACLKLKIPSSPADFELEYFLEVGPVRRGPFKHNFSESTVSECDEFGDWLKHLDADRGLTVAVEIFSPSLVSTAEEAGGAEK